MKKIFSSRWLVAAAVLFGAPFSASAHAFLDHSLPAVGSEIHQSPAEVKIWFTQNVESAFSGVRVDDSQGREVDKKDAHADAQNKSIMIVSLPELPSGAYTVTWHVVSVDTHKTQGHFTFTVKK